MDLWNEMHHTNELRKLEKSTLKNSPEQFDAKRIYDRKTRTKAPSAWNRARDAADELRRQRNSLDRLVAREVLVVLRMHPSVEPET